MQQRIEVLAPGFGSLILARRVLGPRELERMDASLVGGSIRGGTAQLHQQAFFRATPGGPGRDADQGPQPCVFVGAPPGAECTALRGSKPRAPLYCTAAATRPPPVAQAPRGGR